MFRQKLKVCKLLNPQTHVLWFGATVNCAMIVTYKHGETFFYPKLFYENRKHTLEHAQCAKSALQNIEINISSSFEKNTSLASLC